MRHFWYFVNCFVIHNSISLKKYLIKNIYAGKLEETDEGYVFTYDEKYIEEHKNSPVSLTLPIRKEPYTSKVLFSFFDGLIPEGWLLDVVLHNWKLNIRDRFGILLVSCKDPIGVVSVRDSYL